MSEETLDLPEQNYGPGNVLRAKREEYEWSIEAVAEALHLSTHSVKAIEADRYDELPGATYVIGYWRSYARLLGIDIEETIDVNKRNLSIVSSEMGGLDMNRAFGHKVKSGGKGGLLLLIILAALAYYAWQQQFFGLLDGFIKDSENTVATAELRKTDIPADSGEGSPDNSTEQVLRPLKVEKADSPAAPEENIADKADDTQANNTLAKVAPDSGPIDSVLTLQAMGVDQPAAAEATPGANPQAGGLVLAQSATSSAERSGETKASNNLLQAQTAPAAATSSEAQSGESASEESTTAQTAPGMETMVLTLSKDSWLDIRDKTRKRLLYKTEKAGQKVEVTGNPPFYIYIGTPDGVTIQYRGKTVPFETHKTGMFARFKLDDEMLESL